MNLMTTKSPRKPGFYWVRLKGSHCKSVGHWETVFASVGPRWEVLGYGAIYFRDERVIACSDRLRPPKPAPKKERKP